MPRWAQKRNKKMAKALKKTKMVSPQAISTRLLAPFKALERKRAKRMSNLDLKSISKIVSCATEIDTWSTHRSTQATKSTMFVRL